MFVTSTLFFIVLLSMSLMAAAVVHLTWQHNNARSKMPTPDKPEHSEVARFLFRAGALIDANPAALRICAETPVEAFDWEALRQKLSGNFPDFPYTQGASHDRDLTVLKSKDPADASIVTLDQWNDVARVTLEQDDAPNVARRTAILQAMFQAPNPIWKANPSGTVVWRNNAYKALGASLGFPAKCPALFDVSEVVPGDPPQRFRLSSLDDSHARWFNVTAVHAGPDIMYYASEADAEVFAQDAQRSYVQTFSKTFAQLSTGLAIFDKDQKLVLFNPALRDLTGLSASFLSQLCDINAFFDQLRERHVVPTPAGNIQWRKQIALIIDAAQKGEYSEAWTLPSGVTYRVTGRPHPDGALAFLFEDITAEITITRRFRSELEQAHNILDTLDTAMIVFAATGQVRLSNRAYQDMWKCDPDSSFAEYTLRDALAHWTADCHPTTVWPKLQSRVLSTTDRSSWDAPVVTRGGVNLTIKVSPVAGGMTLVTFDQTSQIDGLTSVSRAEGGLRH